MRRAALLLSLAFLFSVSPSFADAAKGSFRFGKVRFEPVDVLAYRVQPAGTAKPVTLVALTNFKIDRAAVNEAIDPTNALLDQTSPDQTRDLVIVRLLDSNKCGLAGFLSQNQQQIDLGESFVSKVTQSTDAHVAGECSTSKPGKMFDDVYEFRLPYDVPITVIPKPTPLAAGGGEPGAAYLKLVKAIQAADWDGAHLHLRPEEVPQSRPAASEMKDYFHGLALNYPKTATVTGGFVKGNRAQLDIRGTDIEGKKLTGGVALEKAGGQWRVLAQNYYFAE